jgi:undecaprenyl-diphosphatase
VLVLAIGTYEVVKHLRRAEQRARLAAWFERQGRRPALRPLATVVRAVWRTALRPLWRYALRPASRVAAPPLRFVGARLTPGELGIELTTLLAVATVSIYVLVLQIHLVDSDPLIAGDRSALDAARDIETGALTTLAKVLDFVGTFGFTLAALIAASVFLISRRRLVEAATLAVGFGVAEVALKVMKEAVERPRPAGGLIHADSWSFPSGHATIAITYLAIAVLLARAGPAARRVAILVGGLVLAVLIGLSRVYLRVHYLSDVLGGWMLGLAAFSVCGAVALVVHYLRYSIGGSRALGARQ